jgi:hypothetical protein
VVSAPSTRDFFFVVSAQPTATVMVAELGPREEGACACGEVKTG